MSSPKRPFRGFTAAAQQTPSRHNAALTPHSKRAHEQRSAAKQRSTRSRRPLADIDNLPNPNSARGILQRLAKITAPTTKRRVPTPSQAIHDAGTVVEQDEESIRKRPIATLGFDDSSLQEDESGIPSAPTPSVLPDDDDDQPTPTFTAIDARNEYNRRATSEGLERRLLKASGAVTSQSHCNDNDDEDITAEFGRRAISEGPPTEPFLRYSFGSIRMSNFGTEVESRRRSTSSQRKFAQSKDDGGYGRVSDDEVQHNFDGETEDLRRFQASLSQLSEDASVRLSSQHDEETFRLELPNNDDQQPAGSSPSRKTRDNRFQSANDLSDDNDSDNDSIGPDIDDSPLFVPPSPPSTRRQTALEAVTVSTSTTKHKRRGLKLTKHGTIVPSLPSSLIRRIAVESQLRQGKQKPKLGKEHMKALEQATEWFFEQVGEDLEAYSGHAGRKKRIDESDVLMLMKRQRVAEEPGKLRKMAKDFLGKEVCRGMDLPEQL